MAAIKKRATNFKGDEKRVLWTVLKGFYTIVENKKTDKITTKLKDQAWLEIANRYNAFGSGITRDTRQLRTFYDNWRRKVKKIFLEENTATMQTSGVSTILDDVDLELLGLIEDKISPLENPYDSDAIQEVNAVSNNGISDTKLECTILADPKLVPAKPFETPPCFSTPKQSEEALRRRREQKKEYMRKARERLKADPLLHAEIKRKDRERYQEAKKQGKVKLIQELSRKEQRRTRKMWRQRAQKYRDRLAEKDVVEDLKDDLKLTLDPGDVSSCTVIIKNKSRFSILHNK